MSECRHSHTDRTGLYIMVFITMLASCYSADALDRIIDDSERVVCTQPEPTAEDET
jgi:hypothetical protein